MKNNKLSYKTNTLYWYANEYLKKPTDEKEIEQINMTEVLYKELDMMIAEGEIIKININAKVRVGKTTVGFALGNDILKLLKKHGYKKEEDKFGMKNIARDQQEYSKIMRDPKTQYTVLVVDESNELENTGENITVIKALDKVMSDVQAGRYVHTIYCSPKEIIDPNTDIILEVIAQDKQNLLTHCKLYYRIFKGGQEYTILLGYVDISVKEIIENWSKNVRKHFYKPEKTEEDKKIIEEEMKKDWYVEYIIKKHEKMDLITREGIFRPRELDLAEVKLKIINELKDLTKMRRGISNSIIKNYVKMEMKNAKQPTSIIGVKLLTEEVDGILQLYTEVWKTGIEKDIIHKNYSAGKINLAEKEYAEMKLDKVMKALNTAIMVQMEELERYKEIAKKYNKRIEDE